MFPFQCLRLKCNADNVEPYLVWPFFTFVSLEDLFVPPPPHPLLISKSIHSVVMKLNIWCVDVTHPNFFTSVTITCQSWYHITPKSHHTIQMSAILDLPSWIHHPGVRTFFLKISIALKLILKIWKIYYDTRNAKNSE